MTLLAVRMAVTHGEGWILNSRFVQKSGISLLKVATVDAFSMNRIHFCDNPFFSLLGLERRKF